jgi:small-conductance mechanosensitive channel
MKQVIIMALVRVASIGNRGLGARLADWRSWITSVILVAGALAVALAAHWLLFNAARRVAGRKEGAFWQLLVRHQQQPARLIIPALALLAVVSGLQLPSQVEYWLAHAIGLLLIGSLAWAAVATLNAVEDFVSTQHAIENPNNLAARRMRTQVQVLRHIVSVVIVLIAVAVMLMTFPSIRHLGESLFASAGVAALVGGFAARSTLSNLFAGLQIAISQPIRLEDVVIVEGEWGWIEEITTTYVIVRVWDLRRLVVPLSYFIEKPFQNWTRTTADLLGTVFIYTDYSVPVEAVRQELHRVLQESKLWDKKVWGLQVTNTTDRSVELRALMSAPSGSQAWDLRCYVREKLIEFLQREHAGSLPKNRTEFTAATPEQISGRRGTQAA